ncbi:MAG: hypothetical protein BWY76_02852 [bacterium ADurb.Bin429]|nr:MAG: hypothetical protein BWY76_02852 [bacterium ADurb.Bin429]
MDATLTQAQTILRFLDIDDDAEVDYHAWEWWPEATRDRFVQTGLLTPRPSSLVACNYCSGRCCRVPIKEPISWQGPYVTARCDDDEVAVLTAQNLRERVTVWTPDWRAWLTWMRAALRPVTQPEELLPHRLWKVGRIRASDRPSAQVYFARGLWWGHDHAVQEALPDRTPARLPDLAPLQVVTVAERLLPTEDGGWQLTVEDLVVAPAAPRSGRDARVTLKYHLHFNRDAACVTVNGRVLSPSQIEYRIFHALAQAFALSPDTYRSEQYLVEHAYEADEEPGDVKQAVQQRVLALRKQMIDAGCIDPHDAKKVITAKRGYGYRINQHLATVTFAT